MENYPSSFSYPDSGDSSPRSREIDFENPPPSWEDPTHQQPNPNPNPTNKVKFMVSYGGKIQPRSHDNLLAYVAGETKILSVDRNVKFPSFFSKLSTILGSDNDAGSGFGSGFNLKYQLPGEDLDALISVTNDDDLENMMHEYDRLSRGSSKPARLRLFLFPVQKASFFESDRIDVEAERFVEVLNPGPPPPPLNNNNTTVDYLFGLENSPVPVPVQVPVSVQRIEQDQIQQAQVDARIQELNRMQISVQEMNRVKSDDGNGNLLPGAPASVPVGYWQAQPPPPQHQPVNIEQPPQPQMQQFQQPSMIPQFQPHLQNQQQQAVYMVHAPGQGNVYHAPMMRAVTGQASQGGGYYQQVYNVGPPGKMGYSEGMLYYAAPGPQPGVVASGAPSQGGGGVVSGGGELRPVGVADPKVVQK